MNAIAKPILVASQVFSISQALGTAIIIQDLEGKITYFNTAAEVHSGYRSIDVVGLRPWDFLISEEDAPTLSQAFQDLVSSGLQLEMETAWLTRDGQKRVMRWSNAPVLDKLGKIRWVVNIFVDITEDKESQTQLIQTKEELKRAVKLRDDFLMIASHELRTPLTPLLLQMQMMKRYLKNEVISTRAVGNKFLKLLDLSEAHVERLNKMIGNLLDVSHIRAGRLVLNLERFDLSQLVRSILERYDPFAKLAQCQLRLEAEPDVCGKWDRLRLEQVVVNLLTNAFKFGKGHPIEIRVWKEQNTAKLSVRDRGIGILPEEQKRLFSMFERVASPYHYEGLGLGLYIVKEIAQAHSGSVRVESTFGAGSTFTLEIPL